MIPGLRAFGTPIKNSNHGFEPLKKATNRHAHPILHVVIAIKIKSMKDLVRSWAELKRRNRAVCWKHGKTYILWI
jgi:hypothetical protein